MFKRKKLGVADAVLVVQEFESLPIANRAVSLERAVQLASQFDLYAYDAYMLACAQDHALPLVTLDGGLKRAARQAGVALLEVKP